jgi:hypothetical protein
MSSRKIALLLGIKVVAVIVGMLAILVWRARHEEMIEIHLDPDDRSRNRAKWRK